jgi:hypothetical protein
MMMDGSKIVRVKCAVMMMGIALFLFAHTLEAVEMDDVSPSRLNDYSKLVYSAGNSPTASMTSARITPSVTSLGRSWMRRFDLTFSR